MSWLMLLAGNAQASDYRGIFSFMYLLVVVSIATAIHLALVIAFHLRGKYADIAFAKKHAGIAMIVPIVGILMALGDHKTQEDLLILLGLNLLACLVALIPLLIRRFEVPQSFRSGKAYIVLSFICGLAGILLFAPLLFCAIATGHMAVSANQALLRQISILLLLVMYGAVGYWIYSTVQIFNLS